MNYKERPKCREVINNILKENKGITLKDIAEFGIGKRKVFISYGIKVQAKKMLDEKKGVKNGK
ncbi:MAG: hypothetical protein WC758_08490 [Candidatus Woesearchaeota archaeon]|jgi:hypothetical protein